MTQNSTIINEFGFEKSIAINPFIFTFFMTVLNHHQVLSKKKNLITLFKYIAVSTLDILNKTGHRELIIKKTDLENMGEELKIEFDEKILVQQPFLLNKILAARVIFVKEEDS